MRIFLCAVFAITITTVGTACGDVSCPLPLRVFFIEVVDQEGDPFQGLEIKVTHLESGEVLEHEQDDADEHGMYSVVTSAHVTSVPLRNRDEIEVHGQKGNAEFTERYVVRIESDWMGRCPELSELEGNRTVVLEM